jgi:hypothetical protein
MDLRHRPTTLRILWQVSNQGAGKAHPKLGMKLPWLSNLSEEKNESFVPFFFAPSANCFHPDFSDFIPSFA